MDKIKKILQIVFYCLIGLVIFLIITLFISPNSGSLNIGHGYTYDTEHQYISAHEIGILYLLIMKQEPNRRDIPPTIIDYKYNNKYIIAKQIPKFPLEQIYYDFNDVDYYLGLDTIYYWIIDKKKGETLGPLSYSDYISIKKNKGINLELK